MQMCPSSPKPAHVPDASPTRFAASPAAAKSTADKTKPKNQDDHFAFWGYNGSHCVAMREDDQNCQGGGTNATGSAAGDNSKGKRNFDFLHLLTSIEQLKKSLQEEEAKDGQHDDERLLAYLINRLDSVVANAYSILYFHRWEAKSPLHLGFV